jgi:hypothetical protein
MALARRHAAARPGALGFLYADGHARVYYGTRHVQKTHVARLKFPAPATMETWVTDQDGDPVFMVVAEPSDSLAGELRRLLPKLRGIVGGGRRVTVCFDRGGWSPALFADILAAGFDLLTYRMGPAPDLPAAAFTEATCTDDRGRAYDYELADTTVELGISEGPRRRDGDAEASHPPCPRTGWRHPPDPHADLAERPDRRRGVLAHELAVAGRELLPLRPRPVRPRRPRFLCRRPRRPAPDGPQPGQEDRGRPHQGRRAGITAAETAQDAALLQLRSPAPGQAAYLTNQMINALAAPVDAAWRELGEADKAAAAMPARIPLGTLAPDMVRLDAEVKQITHAIRMAAYNAETALARALAGHYARAGDEAYALIREALTASGDIHLGNSELLIRLDPFTAPRRTQALAALCDQLTAAGACYPGTGLVLRYEVKSHPSPAKKIALCRESWRRRLHQRRDAVHLARRLGDEPLQHLGRLGLAHARL